MSQAGSAGIPYAVVAERTFIRRVYGWMTGGLLITSLVSLATVTAGWAGTIAQNGAVFLGLIIAQLVVVGYMSFAVNRMSAMTASVCFVVYSVLTGLVFSVIFLAFQLESIVQTFFVTAGTFGVMSVYGYVTKRDLTTLGSLCMMGVLGLVLAMVVNLFVASARVDYVISGIGVLLFVGLTAYDTQKIKKIHALGEEGTDADRKGAVMGALTLYLDFVNLFLFLLRFFGRRR